MWLAVSILNARHLAFAARMLAPLPFGILLASMLINHSVYCEALYLRAHKQEKFLAISG